MARAWQTGLFLAGVCTLAVTCAIVQALDNAPAQGRLSPAFYAFTCPTLFPIVKHYVKAAIQNETRMAASLIRLHFHDCFVGGCEASILLGEPTDPISEKGTPPNNNSVRGYELIDTIKSALERACPNVVSCADIVTLASFFSVFLSGGPLWWVPLGRRDSLTPHVPLTVNLPSPFSTVETLKERFARQNFTNVELVSLSGAHTIGVAKCATFSNRLGGTVPPDPTLNPTLLQSLREKCPVGGDQNVNTDLDLKTPTDFDNHYFQNLLLGNGLLSSDEVLFTSADDTKALVEKYAVDEFEFFKDFAASMKKMGNLNLLTGTEGEIRRNCRVPNFLSNEGSETKTQQRLGEEVLQLFNKAMMETIGEELETLEEALTVSSLHSSV